MQDNDVRSSLAECGFFLHHGGRREVRPCSRKELKKSKLEKVLMNDVHVVETGR